MNHPSIYSIDETHDPSRETWLDSAQGHQDFPIQNLPLGRFHLGDGRVRVGIALGDSVIDLEHLLKEDLMNEDGRNAAMAAVLSPVELSTAQRCVLRREIQNMFVNGTAAADKARRREAALLHESAACYMLPPAEVKNFTDFMAGINHARNGRKMRGTGGDALAANYHQVPIAYHGRASSVSVSGTPVRRPWGQIRSDGDRPVLLPTRSLDIELELGIWVGRGNPLGQPVGIECAASHIAGYCLVNDWSARDVMAWEMDRLGPFLGKSFATTLSPWLISPEALAPFRAAAYARGSDQALHPLPYLMDEIDQLSGGLALVVEIHMRTAGQIGEGRARNRISRGDTESLYWTPAQMLTHHASNGCNLMPGDLLASGTISSVDRSGFGCFKELSVGGTEPFDVGGVQRSWAEDGDEICLKAYGLREGFVGIGFGECQAVVEPALKGYRND